MIRGTVLEFPRNDRLAAAGAPAEGACWLIWCTEHKAYWGPDNKGYTDDIDRAGRYTKSEADKICENGGNRRAGSKSAGPYDVARLAPEFAATATNAHACDVRRFR